VRETTAGDYRYRCRVDLSELLLVNKTDLYPINVTGERLDYTKYLNCLTKTQHIPHFEKNRRPEILIATFDLATDQISK